MANTDQVADTVDLRGARVFVEAGTPIAGGRWHLLPDETVLYERPNGERVYPAVVPAATLEESSTWIEAAG